MRRVNFHLTERQIERLRAEAKRTGLSVADLIRRAVDASLDKAEAKREAKAHDPR